VLVTFAVTEGWKGASQPTIVVRTPASSASCGVDFVEGQHYLVYAQENEGQLQVNQCSRTKELDQASEDLAALGQGTSPSGAGMPVTLPATGVGTTTMPRPLVLGSGAMLLIVAGAALACRQRRTARPVLVK